MRMLKRWYLEIVLAHDAVARLGFDEQVLRLVAELRAQLGGALGIALQQLVADVERSSATRSSASNSG